MPPERLQKIIAAAGVTSRRKAEELITQGRVSVNGQTVTELGSKANLQRDHIKVDGKLLQGAERHVYLLLNKPKGYVTTVTDPERRPTVMDLIKGVDARIYPVGRLDWASEGLLLMTNDSEWAAQVTNPATHRNKTYHVQVSGEVVPHQLNQIKNGITQVTGEKLRAKSVHILRRGEKNTWLVVVLDEGKNRQIRRMLDALGLEVLRLIRVAIGPLELGSLAKGECRQLAPAEKGAIDAKINAKISANIDAAIR